MTIRDSHSAEHMNSARTTSESVARNNRFPWPASLHFPAQVLHFSKSTSNFSAQSAHCPTLSRKSHANLDQISTFIPLSAKARLLSLHSLWLLLFQFSATHTQIPSIFRHFPRAGKKSPENISTRAFSVHSSHNPRTINLSHFSCVSASVTMAKPGVPPKTRKPKTQIRTFTSDRSPIRIRRLAFISG
jgi:hypothetical protein